jgi:hypothetical protein
MSSLLYQNQNYLEDEHRKDSEEPKLSRKKTRLNKEKINKANSYSCPILTVVAVCGFGTLFDPEGIPKNDSRSGCTVAVFC